MSKKKAFSGNTMTLKDFHGGSIPTDLPLPSAPGVIVRPTERSGYDRATSWANPIGRPDPRARPHSSPATRHFDDKTPFLTNSLHIGRNFDEEERKPLDGVSAPRRTASDDSFRVPASHVELKPESACAGRVSGRHGSAPLSPLSGGAWNSYSSRVSEAAHLVVSSQSPGGNHGQTASGSYPNAWAIRKEISVGVAEPVQSLSYEQKLAHASALEKVSSGKWQSKQSIHYHKDQCHKDMNVSKHSETENGLHSQGHDDEACTRMVAVGRGEYSDVTSARHVEKGLDNEDGIQGGIRELPEYERNRSPDYLEVKEKKSVIYGEGIQSTQSDGKFGGSEMQPLLSVPSESSERPKLKLLPRTKPMDNLESTVIDPNQRHQRLTESVPSHADAGNDSRQVNTSKPGFTGSESGIQTVERPKLNLKPRSQPIDQLEGNIEKERNALFGGARPRELVLKERGIDDSNHEAGQHLDNHRVKHNVLRTEKVAEQATPRHGERVDNPPVDQRAGRKSERNHHVGNERADMQKRNWHNENRRSGRETERQQQQRQERLPSPETWRKPAEQPKPVSPEVAGVRYGKAASALELAQAFSKSFSDQKTDNDRYAGQSGLHGQTQMPFSRLMGPTPRPQINGY